jgi:hypothetical protein
MQVAQVAWAVGKGADKQVDKAVVARWLISATVW